VEAVARRAVQWKREAAWSPVKVPKKVLSKKAPERAAEKKRRPWEQPIVSDQATGSRGAEGRVLMELLHSASWVLRPQCQ